MSPTRKRETLAGAVGPDPADEYLVDPGRLARVVDAHARLNILGNKLWSFRI